MGISLERPKNWAEFSLGLMIARIRKGWIRLAVVLTIVWFAVVGAYTAYESQQPFFHQFVFFDSRPDSSGVHRGDTTDPVPVYTHFRTARFVTISLLPIAAIWLFVLGAIPATHWVREGFKT
jgi:hypothetical protein